MYMYLSSMQGQKMLCSHSSEQEMTGKKIKNVINDQCVHVCLCVCVCVRACVRACVRVTHFRSHVLPVMFEKMSSR